MHTLVRKRLNQGQSFLEYTVLAVLVIGAIIYGGPVFINAINANLKTTEGSVRDSFAEPLRQDEEKPSGGACACTPADTDPSKWNPGQCGTGGCSTVQRYYYRSCSPMRCSTEKACVPDPTCCAPVNTGECGYLADTSGSDDQCFNRAPMPSGFESVAAASDDALVGTCLDKNGNNTGACAIGEKRLSLQCGAASGTGAQNSYACLSSADTRNLCDPSCVPDQNPYSTECGEAENRDRLYIEVLARQNGGIPPGTDTIERGLSQYTAAENKNRVGAWKLDYFYLADTASCSDGRYCQRSCIPTPDGKKTIPTSDGKSCEEAACDWKTAEESRAIASADANNMEYMSKNYAYKTKFDLTSLFSEKLDYVAACLDHEGNIIKQEGSASLAVNPGCAAANKRMLGGKEYCVMPSGAALSSPRTFQCTDANQLFFKVWAAALPSTLTGYALKYEECSTAVPSAQAACLDGTVGFRSGACKSGRKQVVDPAVYDARCGSILPKGTWNAYGNEASYGCTTSPTTDASGNIICPDGTSVFSGQQCCAVFCE